jgi:transcriptional regulator with XRE-family HTH domain
MAEKKAPAVNLQARQIGQALRRIRKRADMTQEQAADAANVVVQSWQRYEWGQRQFTLDKLEEIARAVGSTAAGLLQEAGAAEPTSAGGFTLQEGPAQPFRHAPELTLLPVRDAVRAGAWLSVDELDQSPPRTSTTARDPRYPHADQWLAPTVGDSMNLRGILDGDLVHLVDAIAINYQPVSGDIVEVERTRFQGSERELTLKEIVIQDDTLELWPRSTNPKWSTPLVFRDGLNTEEDEVRIRGLMIQLIRRF